MTSLPSWLDSGWVQVVIALLALAGSLWGYNRKKSRDREAKEAEAAANSDWAAQEHQRKIAEVERLATLVKAAHSHVRKLKNDPDHPEALAWHWRQVADNDIKLMLTVINTDLQRLSSIPVMELPQGAAFLKIVEEVVHALNMAKHALERESQKPPIAKAAMERISAAMWERGVVPAGHAVLLMLQVLKGMKERVPGVQAESLAPPTRSADPSR
jgi:hypothetical protein